MPLLLLSELDPIRQSSLLELLQDLEAQIFLTNTVYEQRNLFANKEVSVFTVQNGRIEAKDELSVGQPNAVF